MSRRGRSCWPATTLRIPSNVAAALAYCELECNASQRITDTFVAAIASAGVMFKITRNQAIALEWRTMQGSDVSALRSESLACALRCS